MSRRLNAFSAMMRLSYLIRTGAPLMPAGVTGAPRSMNAA